MKRLSTSVARVASIIAIIGVMPEPAAIAVVSATPGLRLVAEMSLRHHHVQRHALLNVALGIAREAPAVDGLHRHADFTRRAAAANGVAAPELFPAKARFQGQMLARTEGVCITQRVGNGKVMVTASRVSGSTFATVSE